jgi:hypothetical protein
MDPTDKFFIELFKSKWFYVVCGIIVICISILKLMPSWEDKNKKNLLNQLSSIERISQNDQVKAYQKWEGLKESIKGKEITDIAIQAEFKKMAELMELIHPNVIETIENENRLKQQEEEKLLQAKAEKERLDELRKKYRKVDQSAKDALAALKRLEAFTEVGVNKLKYSEALGVAWGDIKIFVESPQGQGEYSELSTLLLTAMNHYKYAADNWGGYGYSVQEDWGEASQVVSKIDILLNQ